MTDPNPNFLQRLQKRLAPAPAPTDDRGRMRMVVDSLVLHLHPTKVPVTALRFNYTWGLGGLSAFLMVLLALTGVALQNNYTPAVPQAYLDVLNLRANVWFGELIRNLHHWSANLLILVSALHLARVFFTGAYRPPRELNWILGLFMFLLILGANFTGYLLPWDQLAYWAITVGTSILGYVPLLGDWVSNLLLGGPEVGGKTLLNFYAMHISFIPLFIFGIMAYHFWRIRKDGGLTLPRQEGDPEDPKPERVTTIPNLVRREGVFAIVAFALLLGFSMLIPAPLEGIANPALPPNPAKAPWYFMGLQELLLHFHPLVGAIILPGIVLTGLFLLPFMDITQQSVGIYFRSRRGKSLSLLALGLAVFVTPLWVLADEYLLDWQAWLPGIDPLLSNGLIPLALILLPLLGLDEWAHRTFRTTEEERILFLFVFLFSAFLVLTLIGIFFRGPGMALYFPWAMPTTH